MGVSRDVGEELDFPSVPVEGVDGSGSLELSLAASLSCSIIFSLEAAIGRSFEL